MATTIVVSPLGRPEEVTTEAIRLNILVQDSETFASYNQIEYWRSVVGPDGPYEELTAMAPLPARLPKGAPNPPAAPVTGRSVVIVGKTLELLINELEEVDVTFTGSDPLTLAQVATQISAQGRGLVTAYVTDAGVLVASTFMTGTGARLRALSSDGAAQLNLPIDEIATGRAARENLIEGTTLYEFEDLFGSADYHYKIRFRHATTGSVSEFSLPHSVGSRVGVPADRLIRGLATLVQADGRPLINQAVHIHCEHVGTLIEGALVVGSDLEQMTDENGRVEFPLVRGQKLTVSIPGTSLYRSITVPTDTTKTYFSLFDPDITDNNDAFKVQVPQIVIAERRSL